MDKNKANALHVKLEKVLQQFAEENDLKKPKFSALRFTGNSFSYKCEFLEEGSQTKEESIVDFYIDLHDLKKINASGDEIVEYHSRKPKFPFIVKKSSGKLYKYTLPAVKKEFAA